MIRRLTAGIVLVATMCLQSASGSIDTTLSFHGVANQVSDPSVPYSTQFAVVVHDAGGGNVDFTFTNTGTVASSITDVYFADGQWYQTTASISQTTGVSFSQDATPHNLPGGTFNTTIDYTADSNVPVEHNGVNNWTGSGTQESLTIQWTLQSGKTYDQLVSALGSSLHIGIHVQGFDNGQSYSYESPTGPSGGPLGGVPEPMSLAIWGLGMGICGVVGMRRRTLKQA
jgi:hypothetical protein